VRVLVDPGIVRDQGEGIPRMFAEMEFFSRRQMTRATTRSASRPQHGDADR
jgi:hypothetical protein